MFGGLFGKKKMTKLEFTEFVRRRTLEVSSETKVEIAGLLKLEITTDNYEVVSNLERMWSECGGMPLDKGSEVFERMFRGFLIATKIKEPPFNRRKDALLPVIRNVREPNSAIAISRDLPHRRFGELVVGFLAFDLPDNIQFLEEEDPEGLGMSVDECWTAAISNLEAMPYKIHGDRNSVYSTLTCGEDYEASHLFNDKLWRRIEDDFGAPVVVAVPTRQQLFFCSSDENSRVDMMALSALKFYDESLWPISPLPLIRQESGWKDYDLPPRLLIIRRRD